MSSQRVVVTKATVLNPNLDISKGEKRNIYEHKYLKE